MTKGIRNMNEHRDISDIEIFENEVKDTGTMKKPKLQKTSSGYFYEDDSDVLGGFQLLKWLIYPLPSSQFFLDNWKKRPIIIKRQIATYLKSLLSMREIDSVLRKKRLYFTAHIFVTTVNKTNGELSVNNAICKATASLFWGFYSKGCNIRILNPENFFPKVHALNAALQEYFETFVGANAYLTPANSIVYAPHYIDTEAFVLQIEGEMLWKVYARTKSEILPPGSSENLNHPVQEILLEAGDMMYFPRGFIYRALAVGNKNSLHITFSLFQKDPIEQLLEKSLIVTRAMNRIRDHLHLLQLNENFAEYLRLSGDSNSPTSKDMGLESPDVSFIHESCLENDEKDMGLESPHVSFIHESCLKNDEKDMGLESRDVSFIHESCLENDEKDMGLESPHVSFIHESCLENDEKDMGLESPHVSFIHESCLENDEKDKNCPLEIKQVCRRKRYASDLEKEDSSSTSHVIGTNPETVVLRRSSRKTLQTLLEEKEEALKKRVRNRLEEGLEIRSFPEKGRGVIATQHFMQGDFVVEYIGELIDSKEAKRRNFNYSQDENIGSYMFEFSYKNKQYCIDATAESKYLGRLINHSINGNLVPKIIAVDEIPRIILVAKKDIFPGQELTFDYGDRSRKSLQNHPWLAT